MWTYFWLLILITHNIQNHNSLFFTLNTKFHILTLYPEIRRSCGLVRKCWSNFEAKHRSFKMYLYSITSRKNIALSIARKCQQMFTDFLLNQSIKSNFVVSEKNQCEYHLLHFISIKFQTPEEFLKVYESVVMKL